MIAQAAAGAILTVAVANGEAGLQRLVDALIGVGLALLFTQVLFSPEPLALLRRAETATLADMAECLHLTAQALERDDDDVAERAMIHLRTLRDRLSDLGRTRTASGRVARRSAVWRSQIPPVLRGTEDAARLDLLGDSCITLTRAAITTDSACRRRLATVDTPSDAEGIAAMVALRTVASHLMVFAGVDADQAAAAVREGTGEFRVPAPPSSPRARFGRRRSTPP